MGKVIYPRKGEVHTVPVTFPSVFADATWEQVIEACETKTVPETWAVGDQKTMTINGTDYPIAIIGKNHDTYATGGTAPLTFQMQDCYDTKFKMNTSNTNSTGWTNCEMRTTRLPSLFALLPNEIQTAIKEVNKLTSAGNQSSNINTTADKLFLLSEVEVFGGITNSASGEGLQYEYYKTGNSTIKNVTGTASLWWTRSPRKSNSTAFCTVTVAGAVGSYAAYNAGGASFAFCF